MKRIDSLIVGPYTVPISYRQISGAVGEYGSCPIPAITIHEDLKGLALASSLYHEALHCLMDITGMDDLDFREERMVRWVEVHTIKLFQDNPELAKALIK